jgi:flagellar motor switch/type III secretory pathway protein FliN
MATAHPLPAPAPAAPPPQAPAALTNAEIVAENALVPSSPEIPVKAVALAPEAPEARLPVELDVCVPVRDFRVRNLLALETGSIVESQWGHGDDVPLTSGNVQLAWSEFEVVDVQLAVRLTRLA